VAEYNDTLPDSPLLIRAYNHIERARDNVDYARQFANDVSLTKYNIVVNELNHTMEILGSIKDN